MPEIPAYFDSGFPIWESKEFKGPHISARSSHTATTTDAGTAFLIFGGTSTEELCKSSFIVNGSTFEAVELSAIEKAVTRVGHTAVDIYNHIYIFGGWDDVTYADAGCLLELDAQRL
jgi:hypothetical protein